MLVKGCIDLNGLRERRLGPADLTLEKIKKASLLKKRNTQGEGCNNVVML